MFGLHPGQGIVQRITLELACHRRRHVPGKPTRTNPRTHRDVYKRQDLAKMSKPGWTRFGFPRMYQTDVLEILWLLTQLGYRDPRMGEALDLVRAKRDENGRWNLDETFNDRFSVPIETRGQPSRWVTLRALEVLTRLGQG